MPRRQISVFLLLFLFLNKEGASSDPKAIYDRFKSLHLKDNYTSFRATFTYIHPDGRDPSESITQEYDLRYSGGNYRTDIVSHQVDGIYQSEYSWDSSLFVRFGIKENDNASDGLRALYIIDDQTGYDGGLHTFYFNLGIIETNNIEYHLDVYDFDNRLMTLGKAGITVKKIYFEDPNELIYSKIEYFDMEGNLVYTRSATYWDVFDGVRLPRLVSKQFTGKPASSFRLKTLENNSPFPEEDFVVSIPYDDKFSILDSRNNTTVRVLSLNQRMIEEKNYFGAFFEKAMAIDSVERSVLNNAELSQHSPSSKTEASSSPGATPAAEEQPQKEVDYNPPKEEGAGKWTPIFWIALAALGTSFYLFRRLRH